MPTRNPPAVDPLRSVEAARADLLAAVEPLPALDCRLEEAIGSWLAVPVAAPVPLPGFDNSAMDGWAVRAEDTRRVPVVLRVAGRSAAGCSPGGRLGPGEAWRIFTGAPLPVGANAVVRQEETDWDASHPDAVTLREGVGRWENVRFRGEDVAPGTEVLAAGTRVGAAQAGLLAALGFASVRVRRRPVVTLLPGGSELRPPGSPLEPGQVYESNTPLLAAMCCGAGAVVRATAAVPDDPDALAAALRAALEGSDVVVTAGGASVGEHDLVRPALEALGGRIEFWRLALKPGKPFFLGRLGGRVVCGLPGNPVSALVTAVLLVQPLLRRLQGAADPGPYATWGKLGETLTNPDGRPHWVRVVREAGGAVRPSGPQASHLLGSLSRAHGLVEVPPQGTLAAGDPVRGVGWEP
ncbi:MAG: gephyrin-like molybdotransferase Glp [Verrucomicrobiota bacterium]